METAKLWQKKKNRFLGDIKRYALAKIDSGLRVVQCKDIMDSSYIIKIVHSSKLILLSPTKN